jgi:fructose-bisphosphate aldolase class 1
MSELDTRILEVEKRLLRLEEDHMVLQETIIEYAKFISQIKENEKLVNEVFVQNVEEDCVNCKNMLGDEDCF